MLHKLSTIFKKFISKNLFLTRFSDIFRKHIVSSVFSYHITKTMRTITYALTYIHTNKLTEEV